LKLYSDLLVSKFAFIRITLYHCIEGMILLSELTRRRIRSVSKLIKVRRDEMWNIRQLLFWCCAWSCGPYEADKRGGKARRQRVDLRFSYHGYMAAWMDEPTRSVRACVRAWACCARV
jgi:hypothetical protein